MLCIYCFSDKDVHQTTYLPEKGIDPRLREYRCDCCDNTFFALRPPHRLDKDQPQLDLKAS